jgi:hypothetical protein
MERKERENICNFQFEINKKEFLSKSLTSPTSNRPHLILQIDLR